MSDTKQEASSRGRRFEKEFKRIAVWLIIEEGETIVDIDDDYDAR